MQGPGAQGYQMEAGDGGGHPRTLCALHVKSEGGCPRVLEPLAFQIVSLRNLVTAVTS